MSLKTKHVIFMAATLFNCFKFFNVYLYQLFIKRQLSVIFYGSDYFSLVSLKALFSNLKDSKSSSQLITCLDVITGNPSNLVADYAKKHDINLTIWPHQIDSNVYDLGVVVSFGYMIDENSILNCKNGMINVHPSLLPRWRGSSPIQRTVLNGDNKTGITIVCLTPSKFDVGNILIQESINIEKNVKAIDLYKQMAVLGSELLIKCISNLEYYKLNAWKQDKEGVCVARKIKKIDGFINWSKMTAQQVDKRFRAFDEFIDIYCIWINGDSLILKDMVNLNFVKSIDINIVERYQYNCNTAKPGLIVFHKKRKLMCVKCSDLEWVAFKTVSLKGYKTMSAAEFYNGFLCKYPKDYQLVLP